MRVTGRGSAVGRPKSTVAHHVTTLVDAGLFRVVRTRPVRAIDEKYYGRVARTLSIGDVTTVTDRMAVPPINGLARVTAESLPAHRDDELRCLLVHACVRIEDVRAFWADVQELGRRYSQLRAKEIGSTASLRASTPPQCLHLLRHQRPTQTASAKDLVGLCCVRN